MSPNNLDWKEPLAVSDPTSSQSSVRLDEAALGLCPVSISKDGNFTNPLLQHLTTLRGNFFPLISNWNFPHCNLCRLSFTLLLHTSKKLGCIFSVPSNWVVKDSDVISPPPQPLAFSGLSTPSCLQSLLVHPWSPSKCAMWYYSSVLSAGLSVCQQGLLLLEQRGRSPVKASGRSLQTPLSLREIQV